MKNNNIITGHGGYKYFYDSQGNKIEVHRRVMEKKLGQPIKNGYEVHHINKNPADNRPSNLMEVSKDEHKKLHHSDDDGGRSL